MPSWTVAIRRGVSGRCPACGDAPLFRSGLSIVPLCEHCAAPLGELPADDAPPYLTILVTAHPVILLALLLVRDTALGSAAILLITLPLAVLLCLALLRPIKGGLAAVLLKLDLRSDDLRAEAADGDRPVLPAGPDPDLTKRPTMSLTSIQTTHRPGADQS